MRYTTYTFLMLCRTTIYLQIHGYAMRHWLDKILIDYLSVYVALFSHLLLLQFPYKEGGRIGNTIPRLSNRKYFVIRMTGEFISQLTKVTRIILKVIMLITRYVILLEQGITFQKHCCQEGVKRRMKYNLYFEQHQILFYKDYDPNLT